MQGAHSARIGCAEFGCLADAQAEAKRVLAVLKAEEPDSLFIIQVLDMDATSPYHSPVATFNPEGSIDGSFKLCNTCQSQT
jgi:hypothetical protein